MSPDVRISRQPRRPPVCPWRQGKQVTCIALADSDLPSIREETRISSQNGLICTRNLFENGSARELPHILYGGMDGRFGSCQATNGCTHNNNVSALNITASDGRCKYDAGK